MKGTRPKLFSVDMRKIGRRPRAVTFESRTLTGAGCFPEMGKARSKGADEVLFFFYKSCPDEVLFFFRSK
jgi:hypothetical protein